MIIRRIANYGKQCLIGVKYLCRNHSQNVQALLPADLRLPPMPTIRDLLRIYKINAQKHLSQNFLLEMRLINKIAKACSAKSRGLEGAYVVEVGPGPGGIARALLQNGVAHVTVIEKDPRFLPTLQMLEDACDGRLQILMGDVMSFDMGNIFPEGLRCEWEEGEIYRDWNQLIIDEEEEVKIPKKKWRPVRYKGKVPKIYIVGNLPFNISTALLIRWLRDISERRNVWSYGRISMTLTFQKEVAERIVAEIGDPQRCRLSVMCQNWCYVDHKFTIPGSAFVPKPKVDVGVVRLVPRPTPIIPLPFHLVEKVVRTIFSSRQKHIKHTASRLFPPGKGGEGARLPSREELANELFCVSGIKPTIRSLRLTTEEFGCLCKAFVKMCEKYPSLEKYEYRTKTLEDDEDGDDIDEEALEAKWEGFDNAKGILENVESKVDDSSRKN